MKCPHCQASPNPDPEAIAILDNIIAARPEIASDKDVTWGGLDIIFLEAAALLGRYDEARKYYDEALKVATEMRYRPEIALTRLNLAELLLEHYPDEKKEALEHLDFAIKEFRDMKMQPSLERALRHKKILET